jgi:glutathione S-transferase
MLTIYGRLNSINVQKAMLCIEDLVLPHRRVDAGLNFGVVDTPEYRAKNPNGLVPTIVEDDGFTLWESNAIVRYLAAKHGGGSLWPADAHARADADRWMDWQTTALAPAMGPAFFNLVRLAPDKRDPKAVGPSRDKTEPLMAILDQALARQRYVAGDDFTVGDVALAPAAHRWLNMPLDRVARPNVERWYADVMSRPSARKVLTMPIS